MSKYRYFELTGESLNLFLEVEGREMAHRDTVAKKMEEKGIEEWAAHPESGSPIAFCFDECPDGCRPFKWQRKTIMGMYEPYKFKRGGEWRKLIDSLARPEDCQSQKAIQDHLSLPMWVSTGELGSGGIKIINSSVGHVGDKVFVKVPAAATNFEVTGDLIEIKEWEFVKYKEESEAQSKEDAPCYRL